MQENLKYRKSFLICTYGVLIQFFILPLYEIPMLEGREYQAYVISKLIVLCMFLVCTYCLHSLKFVKHWITIFNVSFFTFVLAGQYFNPGYHFAVIQYMFVSAIIYEGFPLMSTILMLLFLIEYSILPATISTAAAYPYYRMHIYNAVIFSCVFSWVLERYVSRVKNKHSFLDRKLRYKGIKTDLFMHELKNKFQPLMDENNNNDKFKEIIKTLQEFNSFQDEDELSFNEIVMNTKKKYKIEGNFTVIGDDDFFIDQMDLQTILCNLMTNSQKAAQLKEIKLEVVLRINNRGFIYEDNAGGLTDEQFKFFNQKDIKPYPGHEKNGLGLLLIKKLITHHDGKFLIKKIPYGTRFEINY